MTLTTFFRNLYAALSHKKRNTDFYGALDDVYGNDLRKSHSLEVKGKANIPKGGALLVCNHPGMFFHDGACVAASLRGKRIRFIAHYSDFSIPIVRRILGRLDAIRMDRSLDDITPSSEAVKALKRNQLLCIFPEESYHLYKYRYTLFHFYPKFAKYAYLSGKPIVPTAIIGSEEVFRNISGPTFKGVSFHIPLRPGRIDKAAKMTIVFGKPRYYKGEPYQQFANSVKHDIYLILRRYAPRAAKSSVRYLEHREMTFRTR